MNKGNGELQFDLGYVDKIPYPGQRLNYTIKNKNHIQDIYDALCDVTYSRCLYIFLTERNNIKENEYKAKLFVKIENVKERANKDGIDCTFKVESIVANSEQENKTLNSEYKEENTSEISTTSKESFVENEVDDDLINDEANPILDEDERIEDDPNYDEQIPDDDELDEVTPDDILEDFFDNTEEYIISSSQKKNAKLNKKIKTSDEPDTFYDQYKRSHGGDNEADKYINFVNNLDASDEIREAIADEIYHLQNERKQSADYNAAVNWLENVISLPWDVPYSDNFSLPAATEIIEKSHYGMKDVKDRIIEFLAVRKKNNKNEGAIICLVGPPGVGKTSIAKSIAEALGKKFARFSVGSLHDETDIVGHRRTYVASCPGKLIQSLKIAHSRDPVLLLDEIDKAPSPGTLSALFEVLDPEQNKNFQDVYLDFPFDLSKALFILTANDISSLPLPLLDRMEIIEIPGYTENEKIHIAKDYLIPKQLKKSGLKEDELTFNNDAISKIITGYTGEPGVRNLERCISKVIRKYVRSEMSGDNIIDKPIITVPSLEKFLSIPYYDPDEIIKADIPGSCLGLSVSGLGVGDVLRVEIQSTPGKGALVLTGKLGDVIKESATVAFTWLKKQCANHKDYKKFFEQSDFHLHIPEGAIGKDGPSAGIAFATAFYSLYNNIPTREHLAMTGEINLLGEVTAIGGLKEKILGAKRNNVTDIIIPKQNLKDIKEIDAEILKGVTLHPISSISEGIEIAFHSPKKENKIINKDALNNNITTYKYTPSLRKMPCKKNANCSPLQEV